MKFKAKTNIKFPKFNIDVNEGEEFEMTNEQFKEVKIFDNIRFSKINDDTEIEEESKIEPVREESKEEGSEEEEVVEEEELEEESEDGEPTELDLESLDINQLRKIAKERGIKGMHNAKKETLIERLKGVEEPNVL